VNHRLIIRKSTERQSGAVAFCGTRGIPANYGGFETAVEEITKRLVTKNIEIVVFCRSSVQEAVTNEHEGSRLVFTSGSAIRSLDTCVASIQTGWYLLRHRKEFRYAFWFNNANLPGILLTRLAGIPMAVNTDGLEWRRAKWSWPFKLYYWLSSWIVARLCKTLISDSHGIRDYYRTHFGADSEFVPYGSPEYRPAEAVRAAEILGKYGVESGKFFLQITRIEPDNLPLETATSFVQSGLHKEGYRFIVIGFRDATSYAIALKKRDGLFGVSVCPAEYSAETLAVLRTHCFAYVHGNSVGGTNPALLEAMSTSPRILAIDSPFSKEVLGKHGILFDPSQIAQGFRRVVSLPEQRASMLQRVFKRYSWERVAQSYGNLLEGQPANYELTVEEPLMRPQIDVALSEQPLVE
jgi:glycosyltransferase involved in cell wall biosynthesis